MGLPLELQSGQVGGGITELGREPSGGIRVTVGRPLHYNALELIAEGAASSAVAVAHTASEAYVRYVLEVWSRARLLPIPEQVRSFAFHSGNKALIAAYEDLSEDRALRRLDVWTSGRLKASTGRRNRIVHAGFVCSDKEAKETIGVLDELHRHLEMTLEAAGLGIGASGEI